MLSISLDQETESYLAEIITQENITSKELLKKLIYQHWQTLAQRRGNHAKYLLQDAEPDLSLRENRKKTLQNISKIVIKNIINEGLSSHYSNR